MKQPRINLRVFGGQLAGMGLGLSVLWFQSGLGFLGLFDRFEIIFGAVLLAWPLSAFATAWVARTRGAEQPMLPLLAGLAPLVLCSVLSAMTMGNLGFMAIEGEHGGCGLLMAGGASAERIRVVGFLASGCIWLGCLPGLLLGGQVKRVRWALPAGAVLLVAASIWTLADPLLPATDAIGGPAVRGLWIVPLCGLALWVWSRELGPGRSETQAERGLALGLSAWFGSLSVGLGIWALHRADGLLRLVAVAESGLTAFVWPDWFLAGLSLSAAWMRLAPVALLCLLGSFWLLARAAKGPSLRRAVGFVIAMAVLAVLAVSHETGLRDGFHEHCAVVAIDPQACAAERRVVGFCLSTSLP
jgi:hypothetical protein